MHKIRPRKGLTSTRTSSSFMALYNTGGGGGGYYGGSARQGDSSWTHSSLSNVTTTAGQRSGNGYAKISYIG